MKMVKTTKMELVLGTAPGYFTENAGASPVDAFCEAVEKAAAAVNDEVKIYVSTIITPSRAVYSHVWGCPYGGEEVFTISSTRNPKFAPNEAAWKQACLKLVESLKREFSQSTATVKFSKVSFIYLE